ncbi:MAG TPA: superinfection immunity protein [Acidobacteriaceae bacterium]
MSSLLAFASPFTFSPPLVGSRISVVVGAIGVALYFLPSMIAGLRRTTHSLWLFAANLFLGWTGIGWLVAVVWAFTGETHAEASAQVIDHERLAAALRNAQFLATVPEGSKTRLRQGKTRLPVVMLGAAALLAIIAGIVFINRTAGSGAKRPLTITNAVATQPDVRDPDELEERATFQEIVNACGQPELRWTTTVGQDIYQQNVDHLWYSHVPAEIRLSVRPNEKKEEARHWIFAGAAESFQGNAIYTAKELKERMPCMAPWADSRVAEETENGKRTF